MIGSKRNNAYRSLRRSYAFRSPFLHRSRIIAIDISAAKEETVAESICAFMVNPVKKANREGSQVISRSPTVNPSHIRVNNGCFLNTTSETDIPEIANRIVNKSASIISE